MSETNRTAYFDCLRFVATVAVIILHTCASQFELVHVATVEWNILNVFDSMVRWAVPIFVMISGALFLQSEKSIEQIYRKNILRLVTAFLAWSCLYAVVEVVQGAGFCDGIKHMIMGHYHMWFVFMIIGLYIIVPFLRKILESERLVKYFLVLCLVFAFIIPELLKYLGMVSPGLSAVMSSSINQMSFHFTLGYVFYFVYGYCLSKSTENKKSVYFLGALGFAVTICFTYITSVWKQTTTTYYGYFTINVLLESIMVFVLFRQLFIMKPASERIGKVFGKLSKYSFGAFLVHALVLEQIIHFTGTNIVNGSPLIWMIVMVAVVSIFSFVISFVLNQIPVLKKYIV